MTEHDVKSSAEEAGFKVLDPVEMDLSEVREERVLLPPTNNVKLAIRKAVPFSNKADTYRGLNISYRVEDGITVGEEVKFKGSVVFGRICYFADPAQYDKDFFKKKQHLVPFMQLMKAVGQDISKVVVNDELLAELEGKIVLGDIRQRPNKFTAKDGTQVETTVNEVSRYKVVPAESQV